MAFSFKRYTNSEDIFTDIMDDLDNAKARYNSSKNSNDLDVVIRHSLEGANFIKSLSDQQRNHLFMLFGDGISVFEETLQKHGYTAGANPYAGIKHSCPYCGFHKPAKDAAPSATAATAPTAADAKDTTKKEPVAAPAMKK